MPSRRDLIRMTPEEVDAYLRGRHSMTVGSIGPDGRPHLVAMWYGFFSDGAPGFWTFGKSQKVVNLRRDPRITCLIETGEQYEQLQGAELRDVGKSVVERYFDFNSDEELDAIIVATMAKRVAVKIHVEKTVSWDHAKLGGHY
jgi:hypothetical protein